MSYVPFPNLSSPSNIRNHNHPIPIVHYLINTKRRRRTNHPSVFPTKDSRATKMLVSRTPPKVQRLVYTNRFESHTFSHAPEVECWGGLVGCLNASGNDSSTTETADVGTPSTSPERVGTCTKTRWAPEPIVLNVVISPPISGILPYL